MADFDPKQAVQFRALHCAMAAKAGQIQERHRSRLLVDTLFHCRQDDEFCLAVLDFVATSYQSQSVAGVVLHDFLATQGPKMKFAVENLQTTMEVINSESVEHYAKHYAWQDRVDING